MIISVYRKAHFNAPHRLHIPAWSDEKNIVTFGLCNNQYFHGHNYEMEVKITGEVDPVSGYLIDLKVLKDIIELKVEKHLDHRNLNLEVDYFKIHNPTAENICYYIWTIIRKEIDENLKVGVRLYETPRNFVEYEEA